ncbi:solute carrier family 35 member F4 isoform X1 [Tachysurus ichikawai]
MSSTESNVVEQASCRPDSAKSTKSSHLSTKASPGAGYRNAPRVAANGVHDIEDRILRMTGYYGYYPGYSSHRTFLRPPLMEGLFLSASLMGRYTTEEALLAADSLRIEIEQSADLNT